ncbi:MAG: hypothetical protein ACD_56C00096G0004 [uncultured bacterium]|nr:MAG: hypothetical protein ACD_56C00096G0004 [uncultured bacterium]
MNIRRKIFLLFLFFSVVLGAPINSNTAHASILPTIDFTAIATAITKFISDLPGTVAKIGHWTWDMAGKALDGISLQSVMLNKMAALLAVQQGAKAVIGSGDGLIIRDYNNYLYVSPQQRAMAEMNSFFKTVSKGRYSTLNYEGVGPNYDAYLIAQARQAIGGQAFSTTLQEQVTDPTQLFAGGNAKGIMTYMQCANNPACYTLTAVAKYEAEFAKQQEIAKKEDVGGFLPAKKNGRITSPAMLAQSAFLQIDQLGTTVIMSAAESAKDKITAPMAIAQIWQGAGISLAGRLANYGISDSKGKEAIRNKNDEFPFSLDYNLATGIGISAGGITASTGAGAIASQFMIGNVCVKAVGDVDATGAVVQINGRKIAKIDGKYYDCETKTQTSGTAPSIDPTLPSISCTSTDACNTACSKISGCSEKFGTLLCHPTTKKCVKAF